MGGGAPEPPKPAPSPPAPKDVPGGALAPKPPNVLGAGLLFVASPPPPNGFAAAAPKLGVDAPPKPPEAGAWVPNGVKAGPEDAAVEAPAPKVNAPAVDAGAG